MSEVPLLLVDGNNLVFRAHFGFPTRMTGGDGSRDVTGVFGFFALLRAAVRNELTTFPEIVVVFDGQLGSAARREIDPAYKAHRPKDAAALAPLLALPDVKRGLGGLGVRWAQVDDAEADDVIATLVRRTADRDVVIMSSDKDMYQLVDDRVLVLNTAKPPGLRLIGAKEIEARYGVPPRVWCDRIALVGDSSDGIKGIRGVGPATASRLLAGGLTLEELSASGRLTGRAGRLVRDGFETALECRDLARMRTDVELPVLTDGRPSPHLPAPGHMLTVLGLW